LTQSTTRRPYPSAACSQAKSLRAKRDTAAAESPLAVMKEAAAGDTNLMPPIIDAAKCDALREVWSLRRETPVF
jgi:methylmalonyl-CoA mutase N-terminal domain/subunit